MIIPNHCDIPLSTSQQDLFIQVRTQSKFLPRESRFPHKNGFPWLSYSPERQVFFLLRPYITVKIEPRKLHSGNKRLKADLYMDWRPWEAQSPFAYYWILHAWEFWESGVSSWTHTKNISCEIILTRTSCRINVSSTHQIQTMQSYRC